MIPVLYFIMKVSGMTRLNTAEYKLILIVVFLNFNLLLLVFGTMRGIFALSRHQFILFLETIFY